eukprot:s911_g5.t1
MRHGKENIQMELAAEWRKMGKLWAPEYNDPWVGPETALKLARDHFRRHCTKKRDGTLVAPKSVPHPGKRSVLTWIRDSIDGEDVDVPGTPRSIKSERRPTPKAPPRPKQPKEEEFNDFEDSGSASVASMETSHSIIFSNKSFRLVSMDPDGKRLMEAVLPDPDEANYSIVEIDNEQFFNRGGKMGDLVPCAKYLAEHGKNLVPPRRLPKKVPPISDGPSGKPAVVPAPPRGKLPESSHPSEKQQLPTMDDTSSEDEGDGWTVPALYLIKDDDGDKTFGIFFKGKEADLEPDTLFEIKPDERPEYKGEFLLYPLDSKSNLHPRFVSKILKKKGQEPGKEFEVVEEVLVGDHKFLRLPDGRFVCECSHKEINKAVAKRLAGGTQSQPFPVGQEVKPAAKKDLCMALGEQLAEESAENDEESADNDEKAYQRGWEQVFSARHIFSAHPSSLIPSGSFSTPISTHSLATTPIAPVGGLSEVVGFQIWVGERLLWSKFRRQKTPAHLSHRFPEPASKPATKLPAVEKADDKQNQGSKVGAGAIADVSEGDEGTEVSSAAKAADPGDVPGKKPDHQALPKKSASVNVSGVPKATAEGTPKEPALAENKEQAMDVS